MNYYEQLRDSRWLAKRQEIIDAANGKCEYCDNIPAERLEVHHGYYVKGKMAWEYENETLYCLCSICHRNIQENMEQLYYEIAKRGLELDRIRAMVVKNFETREESTFDNEYVDVVKMILNTHNL